MDAAALRFQQLLDGLERAACVIEVIFDGDGSGEGDATGIDYRYVQVNSAFEAHSGLQNPVGERMRELAPDLDPVWPAFYGEIVKSGKPASRVGEVKSLGRWFEVDASRLGDAGTHEVAVFFQDVTASRMRDELARDARERLEATLNAGEVATWVWHIESDQVFADRNLARLFGVSRADASGGPLAAYIAAIHPDDLAATNALIAESLATGNSYEAEYRLVGKDGDVRRVVARGRPERDADGKPLRLPGVVLDVTNQRTAEAKLRAAEARLGTALEAGHMGTWELDLATQTLTSSEVCKANYGRGPGDDITYQQLAECVLEDDRDLWRATVEAALASGGELTIDYRCRWPDGSIHWVQVRGSCAADAAGKPVSMAGVSILIDERKRAEEALLAADRQKDEFLATASHELRTPLNAILGWARILRSGRVDPTAYQRGLETIERNAQAQVRVIDDILDGSRIVAGKLRLESRLLDLTAVVATALDAMRPAAEAKRISLVSELGDDAAAVTGDPERLQQVVWNLVTNALKFTPRGGTITVRLRRHHDDSELTVSDTGEGIAPDFLPLVFDRFRQADGSTTRRQGGLGLGLALVRYLVEAHGGTVRALSEGRGRGSSFVVTLPLDATFVGEGPAVAPSEAPPSEPVKPGSLAGIRALVVDDEIDARELVATLLEANGAQVVTAASAEQALALLAADPPAVLVSDIGMPVTDGYELLRQLRTRAKDRGGDVPAIAVTAYVRGEDRRKALAAGFQRHLPKPVEPSELVRLVAELARPTTSGG